MYPLAPLIRKICWRTNFSSVKRMFCWDITWWIKMYIFRHVYRQRVQSYDVGNVRAKCRQTDRQCLHVGMCNVSASQSVSQSVSGCKVCSDVHVCWPSPWESLTLWLPSACACTFLSLWLFSALYQHRWRMLKVGPGLSIFCRPHDTDSALRQLLGVRPRSQMYYA